MTSNRELQRLIRQQKRDQERDYVSRSYPANIKEQYAPNGDIESVAEKELSKHQHHERISWGKPAQIAVAKIDNCCPVCGSYHALYERTRLIAGFSRAYKDREIAGALCAGGNGIVCDWSFAELALIAELKENQ